MTSSSPDSALSGPSGWTGKLMRFSSEIMMLIDDQDRISWVSPSAVIQIGYGPADLEGHSLSCIVHPADWKLLQERLANRRHTGSEGISRLRLRHASGHYCHIEEHCHNCLSDPAIGGLVLVLRDISDRVQAEEAFSRQFSLVSEVLDAAPTAIVMTSRPGLICYANKAACRLLAQPPEKLKETSLASFLDQDEVAAQKIQERLAWKGGSVEARETWIAINGEIRKLVISKRVINVSGMSLLLTSMLDLTEIDRRDQEMRQARAQLQAILTISVDAVIMVGETFLIEGFNKGAETMFLSRSSDMVGQPVSNLLPEQFRKTHEEQMQRFLEGPDRSLSMSNWRQVQARRANGELFPTLVTLMKTSLDGRTIITVTLRDMSDVQENEIRLQNSIEEALEASRAKSIFLASMSHELRTPLNAIIGFSEILSLEYLGKLNERQNEAVTDIFNSGQHLLGLVNDILDFSRIEAGRLELEDVAFSINIHILETVRGLRGLIAQAGIELRCALLEEDLFLIADLRRTKQMLINLVSNAIKFTPPDGLITIGARRRGESMAIFVSDTGPGLPEAIRRKPGEPFSTTTEAYNKPENHGAGLGLAIVKGLLEHHGGCLDFESSPETGTCVYLCFPIDRICTTPPDHVDIHPITIEPQAPDAKGEAEPPLSREPNPKL